MEINQDIKKEKNLEEQEKINFVSFSEIDENGKLNEAYGHFVKNTMSEMFEQYEEEQKKQSK